METTTTDTRIVSGRETVAVYLDGVKSFHVTASPAYWMLSREGIRGGLEELENVARGVLDAATGQGPAPAGFYQSGPANMRRHEDGVEVWAVANHLDTRSSASIDCGRPEPAPMRAERLRLLRLVWPG